MEMNSSKRRVVLISQVFYPDQVAVANLFTKLFVELIANHNIEATVWCAQPSYTTRKRQPRKLTYKGISIRYLLTTNFSKSKMGGRIVNVLTFSFGSIFRLLFYRGGGTIVVHTTPPFLAIFVVLLARAKRLRVVYVLMDIFPDGLVRLGKVSADNFFIKLWMRWHRFALNRSDRIITIGRDMQEWVNTRIDENRKQVSRFIPLWQDEKLIAPIPFYRNPFVISHNLQDKFVVQFSGNMGLWNDMVTIGKVVHENLPGVFFSFIGDGIRKQELIDAIGTQSPSNAHFLPFLSNEEYAYSVTACHCGLVTLRNEAVGMAVPSKIIGILAAGIPILAVAPPSSEIARIVKDFCCGYVVDPGDVSALLDAISSLKDNSDTREQMGRNARKAFLENFTTATAANRYASVFNDLIHGKKSK